MVDGTILSKNQLDVQQVAEAIASVLTVEVTIADERLRRIAGTGRYAGKIGDRLVKDSAFAAVLREGRGFIIANPREHGSAIPAKANKVVRSGPRSVARSCWTAR